MTTRPLYNILLSNLGLYIYAVESSCQFFALGRCFFQKLSIGPLDSVGFLFTNNFRRHIGAARGGLVGLVTLLFSLCNRDKYMLEVLLLVIVYVNVTK